MKFISTHSVLHLTDGYLIMFEKKKKKKQDLAESDELSKDFLRNR